MRISVGGLKSYGKLIRDQFCLRFLIPSFTSSRDTHSRLFFQNSLPAVVAFLSGAVVVRLFYCTNYRLFRTYFFSHNLTHGLSPRSGCGYREMNSLILLASLIQGAMETVYVCLNILFDAEDLTLESLAGHRLSWSRQKVKK